MFLFPLFWMVTGSFKPMSSTYQLPPEIVPTNLTLRNYRELFINNPALRWLYNSALVATVSSAATALVASLAGYAFAKQQFVGKSALFWLLIVSLMLPPHVTLIPLFTVARGLGLYNTYWGLILPMIGGAYPIFLMRQFIRGIPTELLDAARVDGASEFGIYWRIILPLSRAALGAVIVFRFMSVWNNFIWQLVIVDDPKLKTLPVGVASAMHITWVQTDYGVALAGASFTALPLFILFILFRNFFLRGIALGALRG
jgi:multiple sugar transport system permease protein